MKICQQLGLMDWKKLLNTLELHNHGMFHHNIYPVPTVEVDPLINYGKINLPLVCETTQTQLVAQTLLVRRLKKTGSQRPMHFNRCPENLVGDLPLYHSSVPPCLCGELIPPPPGKAR